MKPAAQVVLLMAEYHRLKDAGQCEEADLLLPLITRLQKLGGTQRRRGRPRKPLPQPQASMISLYDPSWRSILTPTELAQQVREYAAAQKLERVAGWCKGLAEAVESGNPVQAGHCALYALREMGSQLQPLAQDGISKRRSDKRRGGMGKRARPGT